MQNDSQQNGLGQIAFIKIQIYIFIPSVDTPLLVLLSTWHTAAWPYIIGNSKAIPNLLGQEY